MIITFLIELGENTTIDKKHLKDYYDLWGKISGIKVHLPFIPAKGMLFSMNMFKEYNFTEKEEELNDDMCPEFDHLWVIGKDEFRVVLKAR